MGFGDVLVVGFADVCFFIFFFFSGSGRFDECGYGWIYDWCGGGGGCHGQSWVCGGVGQGGGSGVRGLKVERERVERLWEFWEEKKKK